MTTSVGSTRARGQAPADASQIKAAFIYNFLKFVDSPVDSFHGPQDAFVKVRFDIDTDAAQTARLHVSSLALTRVVHSSAGGSGSRP